MPMSAYYIVLNRLDATGAASALKIISDKKPAKLEKLARKFFENRTWYTDEECYKLFGDLENYRPVTDGDVVYHINSLISFEVGDMGMQETRLEPRLSLSGF